MEISEKIKQSLGDKYFIKRIGGIGGENISIVDGVLFSNDKPRVEVDAFLANQNKDGEYKGYWAVGKLAKEASFKIPEGHYFALGDNSYNSSDSRYFGTVSKGAVVGKACFIYYPFTKRWGLSK